MGSFDKNENIFVFVKRFLWKILTFCWKTGHPNINKFLVFSWKLKMFNLEMPLLCFPGVLVWLPYIPILLYGTGSPARLHLPRHIVATQQEGRIWCMMRDIIWPGSAAHRGEWRHEAPKLQWPGGTVAVAFLSCNFQFLIKRFWP